MKTKKAVSPVVATVLLISMVIILGVIIFMWMRSFVQETITKFGDENIELACSNKVAYEASYSQGVLTISNDNTPIYRMKIKIYQDGEYQTETLAYGNSEGLWPQSGLGRLQVTSVNIDLDDATKVELVPVLLGNSEDGKRVYTCEKNIKVVAI